MGQIQRTESTQATSFLVPQCRRQLCTVYGPYVMRVHILMYRHLHIGTISAVQSISHAQIMPSLSIHSNFPILCFSRRRLRLLPLLGAVSRAASRLRLLQGKQLPPSVLIMSRASLAWEALVELDSLYAWTRLGLRFLMKLPRP